MRVARIVFVNPNNPTVTMQKQALHVNGDIITQINHS